MFLQPLKDSVVLVNNRSEKISSTLLIDGMLIPTIFGPVLDDRPIRGEGTVATHFQIVRTFRVDTLRSLGKSCT
jgi:hypothetical protein